MIRDGWQSQAACVGTDDPEVFFPLDGSDGVSSLWCRRCPVAAECLAFSITHSVQHGVWGGLGERRRANLRRAHIRRQQREMA